MPTIPKFLQSRPYGLQWRASPWFITLGLNVLSPGITTDFLIYSLIIPVMPFHLQQLGFSEISTLVGYLLFAYSGGLALSTPIFAWYSERRNSRKGTLMFSLLALAASQVLLMESREYGIMAIARVFQGISASVVWTAGLALVCDTVPEKKVGRYLGLAMSGLPLGQLIGPPVGGALFDRFGIRGPCIFGVIVIAVDLIGRLLLIERWEALFWGFDPAASVDDSFDRSSTLPNYTEPQYGTFSAEASIPDEEGRQDSYTFDSEEIDYINPPFDRKIGTHEALTVNLQRDHISFIRVIKELCMSSRAVAAMVNSFVYGILYSFQEPTLPVHLQRTWRLTSSQVGYVYIAAALPAVLSPSLAGWFADYTGTEWATFVCLLLAIPCWIAVTIPANLSFFVIAFAFENLCTAAYVAPVTTELALVSRRIPGVGYAHAYGAFNFAVGIGASLGPVIGGEIFQRFSQGWTILNFVAVAVIIATSLVVALYTGESPLAKRLRRGGKVPTSKFIHGAQYVGE
ncbi:MFS general substrate transporter [Multifurca ochricompacta]|uniref:MFS general substrate transporter n=1 Tax=Multifurca ochricompacta TaxID=376703 RepID=A0AAD4MCE3_9AGAM|nr:MFS general substrate transporter [Multifurca ochricompacta]